VDIKNEIEASWGNALASWQSLIAILLGLRFGIVFGIFSLPSFGLDYGFIHIFDGILYTAIVFGLIGFLVLSSS
jgi:hypothetical protein